MSEAPPSPPSTRTPPRFALRAVLGLRGFLSGAAAGLAPPQLAVLERVYGLIEAHVVCELARLGVPKLLDAEPLSAAEIARRTSTNPDAMARCMRAALAIGLFTFDGGRFRNNRLSAVLSDGAGGVGPMAEFFGAGAVAEAWADFGETLRTGRSGFERVHGESLWEWCDSHPDEGDTFAKAMTAMTALDAPTIAAAFPFGELSTICDVGGGHGALLAEILSRYPAVRGVLCDGARVLEGARALLQQRGLADRVSLVPRSFFDPLPEGSDLYLLKNVLHDWDDERAVRILKSCRSAMGEGGRVLVCESLVGESLAESITALIDLQMMVVLSQGRERTRAEYATLFEAAGLRLGRVFTIASPLALIEGLPAPG